VLDPDHLLSIHSNTPRRITFALSPSHIDRDSTEYRWGWRRRPPDKCTQHPNNPLIHINKMKMSVLNGMIPSAVSDTGATSSAFLKKDPSRATGKLSTTVFHLPDSTIAPATTRNKLLHNVREPAHSVNIVPALVKNSLLSTNKFAKAGYIVIYYKDEVNFYNARTTKVMVLEEAILTGWRGTHQKMWRVPLVPIVTNLNTDMLLLDHPSRLDSLNAMYAVSSSTVACNHMVLHLGKLAQRDHIHNVYELPSVEPTIQYLHGAAGFPTRASWLKAIRHGNYLSWPLINIKNVTKFFPESEEAQKGHMQGQRQGVCSTKEAESPDENQTIILHVKKHDILILVYDAKATTYSDQTGMFPAVSSKGNKYVMVLHDVNNNSSWAEPMKNTGSELILAHNRALTRMRHQGINPKHQILNNQASESYKDAIRALGMTYQLVPPDEDWRNMAKKAIQTFKDHFNGVLSGCAATMPIHLWCQLLPQIERQLLLLQQLRLHPNLSAYAHV
jgi:hypothetical protein